MSYVDQLLMLKCAGDVLNAVCPLRNGAKEISEAMAIVRRLRPIVLKEPNKYGLVDLCAGNALASVIAVHLLPIKWAIAFDKRLREGRHYELVKRFKYRKADIFQPVDTWLRRLPRDPFIVIAIHPCKHLAERCIYIYNETKAAKALFLMPCCSAELTAEYPQLFIDSCDPYLLWAYDLTTWTDGRISLIRDKNVMSPKNIIITAVKK